MYAMYDNSGFTIEIKAREYNSLFIGSLYYMKEEDTDGCFCQTLSLILAPEYNYMFTKEPRINKSSGEFTLKAGISLFNSYSGTTCKNIIWYLYFRKGFTPILSFDDQFGKQ